MTMSEAIDRALHHSSQSRVIRGNVAVAEQNYRARKLNFYFPSISLNGNLPSYTIDESYRHFGASPVKELYKTRDLSFRSFLQLHQNLITGGDVTIDANLASAHDRYPNTAASAGASEFLDERSERGYLEISLEQPLLKPSEPKHELKNREDDLALAQMTSQQEEAALAGEVASTYLDALRLSVQKELAETKLAAAQEKARIDSLKWLDEVIPEEDWLASASAALDAELGLREMLAQGNRTRQQLALLLDSEPQVEYVLSEPAIKHPPSEADRDALLEQWDECIAVNKAERAYRQSERGARFAAAGRGLTGDLQAGYSLGRENVRREGADMDNLKTLGWQLALAVSYPLWDGGSSEAAADAARYGAEQAQLEWQKARQAARAEIAQLIDQEAVSLRRLEILRKQEALAENRLRISRSRFDDGRVSRLELLESEIAQLEVRSTYFEEVKTYWTTRFDLEGRFGH